MKIIILIKFVLKIYIKKIKIFLFLFYISWYCLWILINI